METAYQYRFVLVVALLCVSCALLTDRNRLPLAIRGLRKVLGGKGVPADGGGNAGVPAWRRFLAFALILLALVVAAL